MQKNNISGNDLQLDGSGAAAVDHEYFWRPMATCPRGLKVQLLGKGGVAIYSHWNGRDKFFTHWAPLPTKPPPVDGPLCI